MAWLKAFGISAVLFLVLDYVWLALVMKSFNLRQLKNIGRIVNGEFDVWLLPAVIVYLLMSVMVATFVMPLVAEAGMGRTLIIGALMGFCVYGIYDLTNMAVLKDYPLAFAAADVAWGTCIFALVSAVVKRLS